MFFRRKEKSKVRFPSLSSHTKNPNWKNGLLSETEILVRIISETFINFEKGKCGSIKNRLTRQLTYFNMTVKLLFPSQQNKTTALDPHSFKQEEEKKSLDRLWPIRKSCLDCSVWSWGKRISFSQSQWIPNPCEVNSHRPQAQLQEFWPASYTLWLALMSTRL